MEKDTFEGDNVRGFFRTLPSTVPSGPDVGIPPVLSTQLSDWPAEDALECHIKYFQ